MCTTVRGVSPVWAPPEMFDERSEGKARPENCDVVRIAGAMSDVLHGALVMALHNLLELPLLWNTFLPNRIVLQHIPVLLITESTLVLL